MSGHQTVDMYNLFTSAIVRTLNANYHNQSYGIGNMHTTYPVSAFITDIVYLKGSRLDIDVEHITVSEVYCHWSHVLIPGCTVIGYQVH